MTREEWLERQRRAQRLAWQFGLSTSPASIALTNELATLARAALLKRLNPHLSEDQAMDVATLELRRLPAFSHHDDQSEWGALTMELIEHEGIDPNAACYQARSDLADLLAYARDWDSQIAELVPFTPTAA